MSETLTGVGTRMREYAVVNQWKPILWFVKGTRDDNSVMVDDVMATPKEKTFHEWQQSQAEAEYWIRALVPNDGFVCDPFLGSGTTAAAGEKLGRKWIAFEIDEDTAGTASKRISEGIEP